MPSRKPQGTATESLIDRLRGVDDDSLISEVERLLDAHVSSTDVTGQLRQLRDDDLDAVLRQLLGEDD